MGQWLFDSFWSGPGPVPHDRGVLLTNRSLWALCQALFGNHFKGFGRLKKASECGRLGLQSHVGPSFRHLAR